MFKENTNLDYPLLTILSIGKRSFESMGNLIKKSGDTIKRLLRPSDENFAQIYKIATQVFHGKVELVLILDDTLIKKIFSRLMQGSGWFYDTKICRRILAYKLLVISITDGRVTIPIDFSFLFTEELLNGSIQSKDELIKKLVQKVFELFPDKIFTIAADGAFATESFLAWCIQNKYRAEVRMHSNRVVRYNGQKIAIREMKELRPKGRKMARTIVAKWHDLDLHITAQRRIDKHGDESIVFQAATYYAKPSQHVKTYKMRWGIEKLFRTAKQHLGLQECFSRQIEVQRNHVSAVFLAYSLVQLEMKNKRLLNSETAIRALKKRKFDFLKDRFNRSDQIFGVVYA